MATLKITTTIPASSPPTSEMKTYLDRSMVGPKHNSVTIHPATPMAIERLRVSASAASMLDLSTLFFLNVILKVPMCIEVPRRLPMDPKMFPRIPMAQ